MYNIIEFQFLGQPDFLDLNFTELFAFFPLSK